MSQQAAGTKSEAGFSTFISHASEDAEIAGRVCSSLEASGFRCWIAPRDVRPGQDYPTEIIRGIEQSKCLVLVLSDKSNSSPFVRAEVERAYSKGKPVFPMRIEEVLPSRSLELFISTKHWIDAWHGDLNLHAAKLAEELARNPDLDFDLPPELRRRVRVRRFLRLGAGAIVAAAIAVLVALIMRTGSGDQQDYSPDMLSMRPGAFFTGSLASKYHPLEAGFIITDAYSMDGSPFQVFSRDLAFEVFAASKESPLVPLYAAEPGQFSGQYEATKSYKFKLGGLPVKVVSCLIYRLDSDSQPEAALQSFNFDVPNSQFGTFPITKAAAPEYLPVEGDTRCAELVSAYAQKALTFEPRGNQQAIREPLDPASVSQDQILIKPEVSGPPTRISLRVEPQGVLAQRLASANFEFAVGDGAFRSAPNPAGISLSPIEQQRLLDSAPFRLRFLQKDGPVIGPFEYHLKVAGLAWQVYKQAANDVAPWIKPWGEKQITFRPLYNCFRGIRRAYLGESADNLDQIVDFLPVSVTGGGRRDNLVNVGAGDNGFTSINPGTKILYVQLEFQDGSRSEIRKHDLGKIYP